MAGLPVLIELREQPRQAFLEIGKLTEFTLPDHDHAPAELLKISSVPSVAFDVGSELALPELLPGLRGCGVAAALMAMPEAAMHEHNRAVFRQHDVRPAGQILPVQAESKPHGMQDPADRQFGCGVLSTDRRHVAGSHRADVSLLSHNACEKESLP